MITISLIVFVLQAVDVFAASSSSGEMRMKIMKELAVIWELPISSDNTLFPADKPVVQVSILLT